MLFSYTHRNVLQVFKSKIVLKSCLMPVLNWFYFAFQDQKYLQTILSLFSFYKLRKKNSVCVHKCSKEEDGGQKHPRISESSPLDPRPLQSPVEIYKKKLAIESISIMHNTNANVDTKSTVHRRLKRQIKKKSACGFSDSGFFFLSVLNVSVFCSLFSFSN